jgi:hypothetical protein
MKDLWNSALKKCLAMFLMVVMMMSVAMPVAFAEGSDVSIGRLQGAIEGGTGQGSSFYIMKFNEDGSLEFTKQFSGNNITETKSWALNGEQLEIASNSGNQIADFDNKQITKVDEGTYTVQIGEKLLTLKTWNGSVSWSHLILVILVLIGINELCRYFKIPTVILYFIIPIVLIPYWLNSGITHWFRWVKLYSVVFAAVWFTLVRYTKLGEYRFAKFIAAAILGINIAEAVTQDFTMGYLPNVLNAIGGVLNIITLSRWEGIGPDNTKEKDMVWPGMTTFWIVAYDIWNWTFVYLNFPEHAAYHMMVLLSCTIPSLFIKKGTWLQARAFTLAAWMIYLFTFRGFIDANVVPLPRNYGLMLFVGLLSFGFNVVYAFLHFRWQFTGQAPNKLEVGQNASVL